MRFKREDTVQVITGKDRGKRGKVQHVFPKNSSLEVEGVNIIKRHVRARPNVRQAGIVQHEAPFSISKVMLVCTHCDRAVRVGHKILEDNQKVRVCSSCREVID
ncbi:MAG: 50S ribosomal protein L24 [Chloroflexi bacterium]|nr:50S ribosomal protein L24 [Chloroflexota bacterium]